MPEMHIYALFVGSGRLKACFRAQCEYSRRGVMKRKPSTVMHVVSVLCPYTTLVINKVHLLYFTPVGCPHKLYSVGLVT